MGWKRRTGDSASSSRRRPCDSTSSEGRRRSHISGNLGKRRRRRGKRGCKHLGVPEPEATTHDAIASRDTHAALSAETTSPLDAVSWTCLGSFFLGLRHPGQCLHRWESKRAERAHRCVYPKDLFSLFYWINTQACCEPVGLGRSGWDCICTYYLFLCSCRFLTGHATTVEADLYGVRGIAFLNHTFFGARSSPIVSIYMGYTFENPR